MSETYVVEILSGNNLPKDEIHWEYKCNSRKAVDIAVNDHRRLYSCKGYAPVRVLMIQFRDWVDSKRGAWFVRISNKIKSKTIGL